MGVYLSDGINYKVVNLYIQGVSKDANGQLTRKGKVVREPKS